MINDSKSEYTITTLGSHCSLQVLKGAKDEGFITILKKKKKRISFYKRFKFIDKIVELNKFSDITSSKIQDDLIKWNSIIIPHGTLISSMRSNDIEDLKVPIFGNKWILRWESDRNLKEKLMRESNLNVPNQISNKNNINKLCIVKLSGAAGGKGYYLAHNRESFEEGAERLIENGTIKNENDLYIQEFVIGIPVYFQFFYSPLTCEIELLGIDRRYESDIDAIGRIPAKEQMNNIVDTSYNVIGNFPLVLRESLLYEAYKMGENFVSTAEKLVPPGMPGPFCLEGVYDRDGKFTTFEFSARIVAGTNLYVGGSPYSDLIYDEPMSMGKRIAREIKNAIRDNQVNKIVT